MIPVLSYAAAHKVEAKLSYSLQERGLINALGEGQRALFTLPFPQPNPEFLRRFNHLLKSPLPLSNCEGKVWHTIEPLALLKALQPEAAAAGVKLEGFTLVGSAVFFLLGSLLEEAFEALQVEIPPAVKHAIDADWSQYSNLDIRLDLSHATMPEPEKWLLKALKKSSGQECQSHLHFHHRSIASHGNVLDALSLGQKGGYKMDITCWKQLARQHLFVKDAFQVHCTFEGQITLKTDLTSLWEPFLDRLLKNVHADQIETIDAMGWPNALALRLKGFQLQPEQLGRDLLNRSLGAGRTPSSLIGYAAEMRCHKKVSPFVVALQALVDMEGHLDDNQVEEIFATLPEPKEVFAKAIWQGLKDKAFTPRHLFHALALISEGKGYLEGAVLQFPYNPVQHVKALLEVPSAPLLHILGFQEEGPFFLWALSTLFSPVRALWPDLEAKLSATQKKEYAPHLLHWAPLREIWSWGNRERHFIASFLKALAQETSLLPWQEVLHELKGHPEATPLLERFSQEKKGQEEAHFLEELQKIPPDRWSALLKPISLDCFRPVSQKALSAFLGTRLKTYYEKSPTQGVTETLRLYKIKALVPFIPSYLEPLVQAAEGGNLSRPLAREAFYKALELGWRGEIKRFQALFESLWDPSKGFNSYDLEEVYMKRLSSAQEKFLFAEWLARYNFEPAPETALFLVSDLDALPFSPEMDSALKIVQKSKRLPATLPVVFCLRWIESLLDNKQVVRAFELLEPTLPFQALSQRCIAALLPERTQRHALLRFLVKAPFCEVALSTQLILACEKGDDKKVREEAWNLVLHHPPLQNDNTLLAHLFTLPSPMALKWNNPLIEPAPARTLFQLLLDMQQASFPFMQHLRANVDTLSAETHVRWIERAFALKNEEGITLALQELSEILEAELKPYHRAFRLLLEQFPLLPAHAEEKWYEVAMAAAKKEVPGVSVKKVSEMALKRKNLALTRKIISDLSETDPDWVDDSTRQLFLDVIPPSAVSLFEGLGTYLRAEESAVYGTWLLTQLRYARKELSIEAEKDVVEHALMMLPLLGEWGVEAPTLHLVIVHMYDIILAHLAPFDQARKEECTDILNKMMALLHILEEMGHFSKQDIFQATSAIIHRLLNRTPANEVEKEFILFLCAGYFKGALVHANHNVDEYEQLFDRYVFWLPPENTTVYHHLTTWGFEILLLLMQTDFFKDKAHKLLEWRFFLDNELYTIRNNQETFNLAWQANQDKIGFIDTKKQLRIIYRQFHRLIAHNSVIATWRALCVLSNLQITLQREDGYSAERVAEVWVALIEKIPQFGLVKIDPKNDDKGSPLIEWIKSVFFTNGSPFGVNSGSIAHYTLANKIVSLFFTKTLPLELGAKTDIRIHLMIFLNEAFKTGCYEGHYGTYLEHVGELFRNPGKLWTLDNKVKTFQSLFLLFKEVEPLHEDERIKRARLFVEWATKMVEVDPEWKKELKALDVRSILKPSHKSYELFMELIK